MEASRVSKALLCEISVMTARAEKKKHSLVHCTGVFIEPGRSAISTSVDRVGWGSWSRSSTPTLTSFEQLELIQAELDQCQNDMDHVQKEFDACMAQKKELQDKACQLQREVDAWEFTRAKFLRNRQSLVKRLKGLHGEPAETLAGLVRVLCASVDGVPVVRGSCQSANEDGPTFVNSGMTSTKEFMTRKPAEVADTECPAEITQVASSANDYDECCEVLHA